MGAWLSVNSEAIYSTKPWTHQNDTITPTVWYTSKKLPTKGTNVYAILLDWPKGGILTLGAPDATYGNKITLIGYKGSGLWLVKRPMGGISIQVPPISINDMPCDWA